MTYDRAQAAGSRGGDPAGGGNRLEPAVLKMMEESKLTSFYKGLVEDGQNGGVSMHSIYQSEIDHFYAQKSRSLFGATSSVLFGQAPASKASNILESLDSINVETGPVLRLALHLATNDLPSARNLVNGKMTAEPENGYWQVQDLLLRKKESNKVLGKLDPSEMVMLQQIAAANNEGAPEALAWLDMLGEAFEPEIVLPNTKARRSLMRERTPVVEESPFLRAYPNPSNGPVFIVYEVPDGVDQAEVQVVDATGKLLYTRTLAPQNGILELPRLTPGLNVATLRCDGIQIGVVKLSTVK